ncbi:MAG: hypothetical protein AB7V00_00280 [Bacilli bacterium]
MFLADIYVQVIIIVSVFVVFVITYALNKRTKPPKNVVLPEKCEFCQSSSCIIKIENVEKAKEEIRKLINCEKEENQDEKN